MEQIAKQQSIKWTHVPFKGTSETTGALLGGHVDAIADATGWASLVNAGQLRLLVLWTAARSKNWPDVPTLREVGLPPLCRCAARRAKEADRRSWVEAGVKFLKSHHSAVEIIFVGTFNFDRSDLANPERPAACNIDSAVDFRRIGH